MCIKGFGPPGSVLVVAFGAIGGAALGIYWQVRDAPPPLPIPSPQPPSCPSSTPSLVEEIFQSKQGRKGLTMIAHAALAHLPAEADDRQVQG